MVGWARRHWFPFLILRLATWFWDDNGLESEEEEAASPTDPRMEDWKIQKKKGFAKDHDEKDKPYGQGSAILVDLL